MTKSEQIPHRETPEHIALCIIGPDRAQWQRVADMTWSPGYSSGRRLAPHDFAADLPPRWSRALLGLARGLGVGAVMHNKLWHAGLIDFALGGRYRRAKLTEYARSVVRALGGCPHEAIERGPDYEKTYRGGQVERLGCEVCAECGARRLVRPRGGHECWHPADRWLVHALGDPATVRELPDHEPIGPCL